MKLQHSLEKYHKAIKSPRLTRGRPQVPAVAGKSSIQVAFAKSSWSSFARPSLC